MIPTSQIRPSLIMRTKRKIQAGWLIAGVGLTMLVIMFFANLIWGKELSTVLFIPPMIVSFVGFYIINPAKAKDGSTFLVKEGIEISQAVRGGRRATDPPVIVPDPSNPPPPPTSADDTKGGM